MDPRPVADRRAHRFLPTSLLYFPGQQQPHVQGLRADSNGTAAGGTEEDALVQGFLLQRAWEPELDARSYRDTILVIMDRVLRSNPV